MRKGSYKGRRTEKFYLVTMRAWDAEGEVSQGNTVMREGRFQTIEAFHTLEQARLPRKGSLMLECMSNLLANEQFEIGGTDEEILERIQVGIQNLEAQTNDLVIVTNDIFSDGCSYDADTIRYIRLLGTLNIWLAEKASLVTEVVMESRSGQKEMQNNGGKFYHRVFYVFPDSDAIYRVE